MRIVSRHSMAVTGFFGLAIIGLIVVMQLCLRMIISMPIYYFNTLPVSKEIDLDRDGIPDHIDDSDGDGVADQNDPTPYKEESWKLEDSHPLMRRQLRLKTR